MTNPADPRPLPPPPPPPGHGLLDLRLPDDIWTRYAVELDGRPVEPPERERTVVAVPAGRHRLVVERRDYMSYGRVDRAVDIAEGAHVTLHYTPPIHYYGKGQLTTGPARRSWAIDWAQVRDAVLGLGCLVVLVVLIAVVYVAWQEIF